MPGINDEAFKWMYELNKIFPKLSLGWHGPFLPVVNVLHADTVKVILKSSGITIIIMTHFEEVAVYCFAHVSL